MRAMTAAFIASAMSAMTDKAYLVLVEIRHPSSPGTVYRLVNNMTNIIRGGETYLAWAFKFDLPNEDPEEIPSATITIDNVDGRILDWYRAQARDQFATVKIYIVESSSPDVDEITAEEFELKSVSYSLQAISGELIKDSILDEPIPGYSFEPGTNPGLFGT